MTEAEYKALDKQQDSLIKYIRKQPCVMDYVCYAPKEECGYCVPRGILVACNPQTLARLKSHAKRYYPDMTVIPMSSELYFNRQARGFCSITLSK